MRDADDCSKTTFGGHFRRLAFRTN
jgi:hypothetical protein